MMKITDYHPGWRLHSGWRLHPGLRLLMLGMLLAMLWGCETTATKKTAPSGLAALSDAHRQAYGQALEALKTEQPEVAEQLLKPLAARYPGVAELALNLALAEYHQGDYDQALETLQPLLQQSNAVAPAYNLAGLIAMHQGEFQDAEQHYQQALAINPHYPKALYNLGLLHDVYFQQIAPAVDYYDRYLSQVEEDQETQIWVEHLRVSLGRE